ncbi:MAG: hypothetical protein KDD89_16630, partial [Anaerolineales bacterium]|nr:hypothetical protein [Anaerolineales bacterium]
MGEVRGATVLSPLAPCTLHLGSLMPELPEVETVVRALRSPLVGRTFVGFESAWPKQIVVPDDVVAFAT